jgi:hypothetical protein
MIGFIDGYSLLASELLGLLVGIIKSFISFLRTYFPVAASSIKPPVAPAPSFELTSSSSFFVPSSTPKYVNPSNSYLLGPFS